MGSSLKRLYRVIAEPLKNDAKFKYNIVGKSPLRLDESRTGEPFGSYSANVVYCLALACFAPAAEKNGALEKQKKMF